jgi:hypothetical protein
MAPFDPVLISVLASTDATWLPVRKMALNGRMYVARREFKEADGASWRSGAATELGRKHAQRAVEQLATEGKLIVSRRRAGKNLALRLSDDAENRVRLMCRVGGKSAGYASMLELSRFQKRPPVYLTDHYISEELLAGHDYDGTAEASEKYVIVEDLMLWALVRELVVAVPSMEGHCRYSLTPAGWAKIDSGWTEPFDDEEGLFDPKARAIYLRCIKSAQRRIEEIDEVREIGPIALPVAYAGMRGDVYGAKGQRWTDEQVADMLAQQKTGPQIAGATS